VPGGQELLVIVLVALLVFGPDRLPEIARTVGRFVARFRSEAQRNVDELKRAVDLEDLEREVKGLSQEMRGVRDDVTGRAKPRRAPAGPPVRADDQPPPVDLEAT
jgi:sec-independent protein translocase protein TatB